MSKKAFLHDGTELIFPDDTPDSVIQARVKTYTESLKGAGGDQGIIGESPWYAKPILGGPSVLQGLEALPGIGGMVGGLVGGAGGSVPGALGGATLGGAAGEAARQHARRAIGATAPETSGEAAYDIGKSAVTEGSLELGGLGLMKGGRALFTPGAAGLEAGVKAAATRQGVEMPASALSSARPAAYAEAYAAEGIGGTQVSRRVDAATQHLTAIADQIVARAEKGASDINRGEAITKGLKNFKDRWIARKNALYKEVDAELPGLTMQAEDTVALLDEIVSNKAGASRILQGGPTKDKGLFDGLLKGLTNEVKDEEGNVIGRELADVSVKDFREAIREVNQVTSSSHADPFAAANKGLLEKLAATLDEDLGRALQESAPEAAEKLAAANRVYAEGIGKINSVFGKAINKYAQEGQYDKVGRAIVNPRISVADIPKIMEVVGPDGQSAIRATVVADIAARAKNAQGMLTPQGVSRAMKQYGPDRLKALLTPEQYGKLNDLATLTGAMERVQKVISGSPTAGKLRWAATGGAVTGAFLGQPEALVYIVGDVLANKFIGSKVGQKWLTTGFPILGDAVGGVVRQAPRATATTRRMAEAEE